MNQLVLQTVGLFLAGLLAGEELVVRYGVHPSLAKLDERSQIVTRQALILRLRILVPSILVPTVVCGIATLVTGGSGPGVELRWAGALSLLVLVLVTALGTVNINKDILEWNPESPPPEWKAIVRRWEQLDTLRSSAAILAFGFFLVTFVQRVGVT